MHDILFDVLLIIMVPTVATVLLVNLILLRSIWREAKSKQTD